MRTAMIRFAGISVLAATLLGVAGAAHAQVADPRVMQLEERVRQLTGQLEELNFQFLQLQEQLRRQQEDYEFRFQELEGGAPAQPLQEGRAAPAPQPPTNPAPAAQPGVAVAEAGPADRVVLADPGQSATGAPPRALGTLTIDPSGAVVDSDIDFSSSALNAAIDGEQVASITGRMDPEELYRTGYGHVLNGDYRLAEDLFRSFIELYPNDLLAADARFWLGESVLGQGRYEDAAAVFIEARTLHPQAAKAPETMLKIGTIMAALGNRDMACVTLSDALEIHGGMNANVRQAIIEERAKARC